MSNKCAWIITLGADDTQAQTVATQLSVYGLSPQGQRWSTQDGGWMASAQEAAQANAAIILLTGDMALFADATIRRQLAMFRLALQTNCQRAVNGLVLATAASPPPIDGPAGVLDDWLLVTDSRWAAKAVARAHAPVAPAWPVRLGLHVQERLGVWLEVHPSPEQSAQGALLGVSGSNAGISFHAVGPMGALPHKTINEYELQGLKFDIDGLGFEAWAVQNVIPPDQSYFVRLENEPDFLAIGALPSGEPDDVRLFKLG